MANPIDLTTLDAVKTYLGITDTNSDVVLQALITAASQYVINFCGRNFAVADYDEWYAGTGNDVLMLRNTPVNSVAMVVVNGIDLTSQLATDGNYAWCGVTFDSNSLTRINGVWDKTGPRHIRVKYNAGYNPIPFDLAQAVNDMVGDKYKRRANIGIQSRVIANETITYTQGDVPKSAQSTLSMYQRAYTLIQ